VDWDRVSEPEAAGLYFNYQYITTCLLYEKLQVEITKADKQKSKFSPMNKRLYAKDIRYLRTKGEARL
jgi:hypothetical protein